MIRWNNDYNHTAHPAVLQALAECSEEGFDGYGQDRWCRQAADRIRQLLGPDGRDADVQFLSGGTQSNLTVITAGGERHLCRKRPHPCPRNRLHRSHRS